MAILNLWHAADSLLYFFLKKPLNQVNVESLVSITKNPDQFKILFKIVLMFPVLLICLGNCLETSNYHEKKDIKITSISF